MKRGAERVKGLTDGLFYKQRCYRDQWLFFSSSSARLATQYIGMAGLYYKYD